MRTQAKLIKELGANKGDEDAALYEQRDFDLFVSRWYPHYGVGWPEPKTLRDFNLDRRPEDNPTLIEVYSIYMNYADVFLPAVNRMAA